MNSLFLACLALFFSQAIFGRDNWGARSMALGLVAGLLVALFYSVG